MAQCRQQNNKSTIIKILYLSITFQKHLFKSKTIIYKLESQAGARAGTDGVMRIKSADKCVLTAARLPKRRIRCGSGDQRRPFHAACDRMTRRQNHSDVRGYRVKPPVTRSPRAPFVLVSPPRFVYQSGPSDKSPGRDITYHREPCSKPPPGVRPIRRSKQLSYT